jgi:hypothetical protein
MNKKTMENSDGNFKNNKEGSEIISTDKHELALRSQSLVLRGLREFKELEKRILHFPSDFSLGILYIGNKPEIIKILKHSYGNIEISNNPSIRTVSAQGEIQIGINEKVLLDISESDSSLAPLANFSSNAIWALKSTSSRAKKLTDDDVRHLAGITDLHYLSFYGREISSTGLKYLVDLERLKYLNISTDTITNTGLLSITKLKDLEDLHIDKLKNDVDLSLLNSLSKLKCLYISTDTFTNTGLSSIAKLINLEELDISFLEYDVDLSLLNSLSKLRRIELAFKRVSKPSPDVHIGSLTNLPELEFLHIFVVDNGITGFSDLKNLQSIEIADYGFRLTGSNVNSIFKLKNLESLRLWSGISLHSPISISPLSDLPSLSELHFYDSGITDSNLAVIADLKNLQTLSLSFGMGWSQFTDEGLSHLKKLPKLKHLILSGTSTTDAGLANIGDLIELESLFLRSRQPITDYGLQCLTNLIHLMSLDLRESQISDEGLLYVQELKNLEILNLDMTSITDKGLAYITNLESLKELSLNRTKVTDAGVSKIMETNPSLRIIR